PARAFASRPIRRPPRLPAPPRAVPPPPHGRQPATLPCSFRCSRESRALPRLGRRPALREGWGRGGLAEDGGRRQSAWLRAARAAPAPRSRRAPSDHLSPPRAPPRRRLHPPAP